jgi:hypothetical protein
MQLQLLKGPEIGAGAALVDPAHDMHSSERIDSRFSSRLALGRPITDSNIRARPGGDLFPAWRALRRCSAND